MEKSETVLERKKFIVNILRNLNLAGVIRAKMMHVKICYNGNNLEFSKNDMDLKDLGLALLEIFKQIAYALAYALKTIDNALTRDDLDIVKKEFIDLCGNGKHLDEAIRANELEKLENLDEYLDLLFIEVDLFYIEGTIGTDYMIELAKFTIVNALKEDEISKLIKDFQILVRVKIKGQIGLSIKFKIKLIKRLAFDGSLLYKNFLTVFGDGKSFLIFVQNLLNQLSEENFNNVSDLMVNSNSFEKIAMEKLNKFSPLLEIYADYLMDFLAKNTYFKSTANIENIWKNIYQWWLMIMAENSALIGMPKYVQGPKPLADKIWN